MVECPLSRHSGRGRPWSRIRAQILATSTTCWRCGHPGSQSIGHIIPASLDPTLRLDPANLRPEHGVEGCPTCGRKCNQEAGNKLVMTSPPRTSRKW